MAHVNTTGKTLQREWPPLQQGALSRPTNYIQGICHMKFVSICFR